MQTIEVKLNQIKYASGIELRSKIRNGERFYILDGMTIEKIIKSYTEQITILRNILAEKNKKKNESVKNESHINVRETGNKFGGGYGD